MLQKLWNDDAGVILSAEIVMVGTVLGIGTIVGLTELQGSVVNELNDVGEAVGSINQSYYVSGVASVKFTGNIKARTVGSVFIDAVDSGDGNECSLLCQCGAPGELSTGGHRGHVSH